jgi:hypothetical protein
MQGFGVATELSAAAATRAVVSGERRIMPVIAMRTLFVGKPRPQDVVMLTRMGRRGWGSYSADSLSDARPLIAGGGFDLVLALQCLADGSGYELISQVRESGRSLFVGIELLRERLWIPVVELGERVFGERASHADSIESELEQILAAAAEGGNKDAKKNAGQGAPASQDIGYAPIQISLDSSCGTDSPPASPKQSRISVVVRLQLRCASFGLLRAVKSRDEAERFDKAIPPVAGGRRAFPAHSISGMRSRGRRD